MAVPFEVAVAIAGFILVATFIAMIAIYSSRKQAAKEEELRQAASARGWTFETRTQRGFRIQRWTGSTDGVSWEAESLAQSQGKHRRYIARWHGAYSPGINGPIVAMGLPKGKEDFSNTVAEGQSWVARLARQAAGFAFDKAIDMYFGDGPGKEVDAGAMHRLDTKIPGYVVMAADKDEGARILQQGLARALLAATGDKTSVLSDENRPWIFLRPHAISIARMERFRDANDIDRFVQAGIALTRVFTFGRRSLS